MRSLSATVGMRPRLAVGLLVGGCVAVAAALAANSLGLGTSSAFGWKKATLLIAGCDLIIASLIASTPRTRLAAEADFSVAALVSGAIADGVVMFAISGAAVIVLFGQSKPIERLGYFLAIFVIVPLSVTLAWRRQRAGSTGDRQELAAFATLVATAAVLCAARVVALSPSATVDASLFVLILLAVARGAIALSVRLVPAVRMQRVPTKALIAATPLVLAAAAAPFVPPVTLSVLNVVVGLVGGLVTFGLVNAYAGRRDLPRSRVWALDVGMVLLSTLVVVYLAVPTRVLAANHDYFLGPAVDVLHGHPMLLSTFSQYGVGVMDALAGIFLVVPMGYGTFTLLLSAWTAALFAVIYIVLRWSTRSVLIAAMGLTVAVVLDIFGQLDYYTWFPSTGVLRFGLPWLVILFSLASARTSAHQRRWDALLLATVAAAAVWSGEAGVYCLGTAVALACLDAAVADGGARRRVQMAIRRVAPLLAASAAGLLTFTLTTRVTAGAWPHWKPYLDYIRLYTTQGFGNLPISPWSPGLALGALYTASAIVIVLVAVTRPAFVRDRLVAFRAASGLTVLGALVYTYFLGRAHPNNLIHVSPPAVALVFVWLGIVSSTLDSRVAVAIASATTVFLGVTIVASERADISKKYPTTALAAVLGNAPSLTSAVRTLWRNPLVDQRSAHVVEFVSTIERGSAGITLLLTPNVETEALLRLRRANAMGSSQPCQESLTTQGPGRAAEEVAALQPGGIVVTSSAPADGGELLPIEQYTLVLLRDRFVLQEIAADGKGLQAFRMTRLASAPAGPPAVPLPPAVPVGCA
jgi:hypothetical protein